MKYGVYMFTTDETIPFSQLAQAAERRGFESAFICEHTHVPTSRRTPSPRGGDIPPQFLRLPDPFVALAHAAALTSRIKLGTGVCLVVERDPIILAKEVATLDQVSGGRFIFGIGAGWNVEEAENHGVDFKRRWKLLREQVEAMKAIWTHEEAQYHGEFVNFDPIWCAPKPIQKPYPPILLGGRSGPCLKRVIRYCDGWIPNGVQPGDLGFRIAELRRQAEAAGRDPKAISITCFSAPIEGAALDQLEAAGVERAVFQLKPAPTDEALAELDGQAKALRLG